MSLVYALVARDQTVLVDHSDFQGNFSQVALHVLAKVDPNKTYAQFASGNYCFYVYVKERYAFLAMVGSSYDMRIALKFLNTIQSSFFQEYEADKRETAVAHSLKDFNPVVKYWMEKYKNKAEVDKLQSVKKELSQVQEQTRMNLDRMIDRGEKIEVIAEKGKDMAHLTYDMAVVSKHVRHKMWWNNKKLLFLIIAILLAVVAVVVILIAV